MRVIRVSYAMSVFFFFSNFKLKFFVFYQRVIFWWMILDRRLISDGFTFAAANDWPVKHRFSLEKPALIIVFFKNWTLLSVNSNPRILVLRRPLIVSAHEKWYWHSLIIICCWFVIDDLHPFHHSSLFFIAATNRIPLSTVDQNASNQCMFDFTVKCTNCTQLQVSWISLHIS